MNWIVQRSKLGIMCHIQLNKDWSDFSDVAVEPYVVFNKLLNFSVEKFKIVNSVLLRIEKPILWFKMQTGDGEV